MARSEFSKKTKRSALERSQMRCEASGALYGLQDGIRCSVSLSGGVEFDHLIADALGGDNSLENCVAACTRCHRFKTSTNDVPKAAKTVRVRDKALGIKSTKAKIQSQGFPTPDKPERAGKPSLPPREMFRRVGA